ncbi:hypothetical protein FI667_g9179, partial [Globisporangium splendens]
MLRKFTAISALVAAALSVGGADAKHFHIKVFSEKAVAADTTASSGSSSTGVSAGDSSNPNTWHMKQVTSIQARVQGDAPVWDDTAKAYLSKFGSTTAEKYRSVLDTVNTASVEGALMFVQAEGINVAEQSVKCQRKNSMQYVVFYEMTIVQPTYAIAAYQSNDPVEYTPFLAMDGAKCTDEGSDLPKACKQLYGLGGELDLGASVGAQLKASDPRAPYPGNYWFSFPNSCADKLRADKTDACRAEHSGGLCPMGVTPDGEQCSFSYKILGYLNIDDLVGITSLKGSNGKVYSNYTEFCNDGGIEFDATNTGSGFTVKESLPFWENPGNETANAERFEKMVALFNKEAPNAKVGTMTVLPEIADLVKANPKCYENSEQCAKAKNGCRRTLYSQICEVCSSAGDGCEVAPSGFTYPTLIAATLAPTPAPGTGSGSGTSSKDAGTTSSAMTASSAFASVALALSVAVAALL